jgi:hypothetical protein
MTIKRLFSIEESLLINVQEYLGTSGQLETNGGNNGALDLATAGQECGSYRGLMLLKQASI